MWTPLMASSNAPSAAMSLTMAHSSWPCENWPACFFSHLSAFSCERAVPRTLRARGAGQLGFWAAQCRGSTYRKPFLR